jgi:hypothetical protein
MSASNICIIVIPLKDDEATNAQVEIIRRTLQLLANDIDCTIQFNEIVQTNITDQESIEQ